jgi:hypothetical protein
MAATAAAPGNIVVPLSTILDQLKGKLSDSEVNALLLALVSQRTKEVRPGDLITAELFNQILGDIADLTVRVAQLEGSTSGPRILGRTPPGDVTVLGRLTVLGTGFDPQSNQNTVNLGGVSINSFFDESDETQLSFQVPDLFTGLPRLMELTVSSGGHTSNAVTVRVQPRTETQGGNVVIFPQTQALGAFHVGPPAYTLRWLVDGQTALPATYRFRLLFTNLAGAAESAWTTQATLDPSSERQIVRGNPLPVTATVTIPSGATRGQIALEVRSTDGTMVRTSDPILFEAGSTPQVSDPRANLTLPAAIGPFDANGNPNPLRKARLTVDGNELDGLQLKFNSTAEIPFDLFVTSLSNGTGAGNYAYSAEVENPGTAWHVTKIDPTSDTAVPASGQRKIKVTLQNTDTASSNAIRYMVVRAQHTPAGSGASDFVSFIRFPIQGFTS